MIVDWEVRNTNEDGDTGGGASLYQGWREALRSASELLDDHPKAPIMIEVDGREAFVVPCELFASDDDNTEATRALLRSLRADYADTYGIY